jgi:lipoprotein-anchoring transpeptidase ErfK/SrfK
VTGRRAIGLGLLAGAAAGAVVVALSGGDAAPAARVVERAGTPVIPALRVGAPRPLRDGPDISRWAHVRRAVVARAAPGGDGRAVARLGRRTPEGVVTAVPVSARAIARDGRLWLRVTLPVLPNGTTGWVPRSALGAFEISRHRLVVDLARRRLTLFARGRAIFRAPIGVGAARWPTPRGTFLVRSRLTGYTDPAYGPVAFGLSARSPVLTDWPAGGFVGIHGTDRPDLVPGAISHGCVRLRNPEMLRLARLLPVGTPVEIR